MSTRTTEAPGLLLSGALALVLSATTMLSPGLALTKEPQSAPTDPGMPTVAEVLDRYVQASGGEALASVQSVSRTGTLVRGGAGRVPFTAVSQTPGRWVYDQVFAYGEAVRYGFDGTGGWVADGKGTVPMPAAERLDLQVLLDSRAPLRLREIYPEMTVKGVGRSGESEAVIVSGRSREGVENDLLFDRKTGLLLQAGDVFFEDYRAEGKLVLPHRVLIGAPGGEDDLRLKMEMTEVRLDESVDPTAFAPSSCPLPARKPPLYTLRKQVTIRASAMDACVGTYQHPTDPKAQYSVSRQGDHLMIEKTGWGRRFEIKPESELDYFVRFLGWEFHFVRDAAGRVVRLEIGSDRKIKAERVD